MGKELKENWKDTGKQLGGAFKSLGKTLFKTGKVDEAVTRDDEREAEKKAQANEENK